MIGPYLAPKKTPCTPLELAQAYELALGGDGNVDAEFIAVLMAHGVLETGRDVARGLIATSCYWFNFGNVKASNDWAGSYTCIRLNEYLTINGVRSLYWFSPESAEAGGTAGKVGTFVGTRHSVPPGHPQTRMRAFLTLAEGVERKIAFLKHPRFARAWAAAKRGDAEEYVAAIHQQRYFTADLGPYARAVVSLYHTYWPIAKKISDQPIVLTDAEETDIDACIALCARTLDRTTPEHVAAVQIDLAQEWRESNKRGPSNA
jgi:hypothetical protein